MGAVVLVRGLRATDGVLPADMRVTEHPSIPTPQQDYSGHFVVGRAAMRHYCTMGGYEARAGPEGAMKFMGESWMLGGRGGVDAEWCWAWVFAGNPQEDQSKGRSRKAFVGRGPAPVPW